MKAVIVQCVVNVTIGTLTDEGDIVDLQNGQVAIAAPSQAEAWQAAQAEVLKTRDDLTTKLQQTAAAPPTD